MPKPTKTRVTTVADYMAPDVRSIHVDKSLKDVCRMFRKWNVGSLLVDDGRRYVGIITERDLCRKAVAQELDPAVTPVKACMSRPVISIEDDEPIVEAVKLMRDKGIRHIAVTEDNTIIGMLSVSDLLRYYSGVK
jgi:CBS domain-containing protein